MSTSQLKFFDTVCGMELDMAHAKYAFDYNGDIYYFCSHMCQTHFKNNPERYSIPQEEVVK